MAWLESRNGSWRVVFRYKEGRYAFTVGEVSAAEAAVSKASTEELLRLLKRNLIDIPAGCSIEDFMYHRGKPPEQLAAVAAERKELTLGDLREAYFHSQAHRLEQTTLDGIRLHFDHLTRILGSKSVVPLLARADLQRYVNKRAGEWIDPEVYRRKRREKAALAKPKRKYVRKNAPPKPADSPERPRRHPSAATIKKEIISLRTAWNWARRHLGLAEEFPGSALDYAKTEEALPFMTWEEAERRIAAGDDAEHIWDSVYLRPDEITGLLAWVKARPVSPWVYPMFVFAAYTGARRSEMVRALPSDVDLDVGIVTIREKKRDKRKLTTRRVPLTPLVKEVLAAWMAERARGKTLFCKSDGKEIMPREAHNYFQRGLRLSKWSVLKGWHVFRHSFISALASNSVDQRVIDDLVGHSTEEQRRRYRHLYPDVKQQALSLVFAPAASPPAGSAATPGG
jgi:integrase